MSIKERLLAIKTNVHSVTVGDDKFYFKHLRASHNTILSKMKDEDVNTVAFILAACEEDGSEIFTMDDIELVKDLPRTIVNVVSNAALIGNEAKPLGV